MRLWSCGLFLLVVCSASLATAQCEHAAMLYEQAIKKEVTPQVRIQLLRRSLSECEDFGSYFKLGRTYAELHEAEPALDALRKAYGYAATNAQKASTLHLMGTINERKGNVMDALLHYKAALRLDPSESIERDLKEIDQNREGIVVPARQIVMMFQKCLQSRLIGIVPAVDIRVLFEFDSAVLTTQGRKQADEIGKALTSAELTEIRFILIGHTDSRGSDEYNDDLSMKRATVVKTYLTDQFHLASTSITVKGRGKHELLYRQETDETAALNRRVEVQVK